MSTYYLPAKDIIRYASVSKPGQEFDRKKISSFIPSPNEMDYSRGYIPRYFVQKANDKDAKIFEIDNIGFSKFTNSPFHTTVQIDWRIIGSDDDIKQSNMKSINLVRKDMPALKLYLLNLLQFRQKENLEM